MTAGQKRAFKKLFNRIDYSIKIANLYYDYEKSYLDFCDKGRIYFKDKKGGKYCLIIERVLLGENHVEAKINMRLYSCSEQYFMIDYDNEIFYRGFYPTVGYMFIGNTFINTIDDYFKGFYSAYRTMEVRK